ncbi:hypothetical protein Ddye_012191, partial [Dipteronia dyeriana]
MGCLSSCSKSSRTQHIYSSDSHQRRSRKGASSSPLVKYGTSFVPEKEKALEWMDYIGMIYTDNVEALQQWPQEC